MTTLSEIVNGIQEVLQDSFYTEERLVHRINGSVRSIAAGIRMPDGLISPPLPDLYKCDTVYTTSDAFVDLPSDYQRSVFNVFDANNDKIYPPIGGDYYSFNRFLKQINQLNLSEPGEVYRVCVKGSKYIYYQGIPAAPYPLGIHYYKKPVSMKLDGDVPDGIPDHLAHSIIKHDVLRNIYGEKIEAGVTEPAAAMKYHTAQFYSDMQDLIDFIGIDGGPIYYGSGGFEDRGIVD
jgi:hypothetical protein